MAYHLQKYLRFAFIYQIDRCKLNVVPFTKRSRHAVSWFEASATRVKSRVEVMRNGVYGRYRLPLTAPEEFTSTNSLQRVAYMHFHRNKKKTYR